MNLSPHFTFAELIATAHRGIDNTPPAWVVDNLRALCLDVLEPLREVFGPLHVVSGYRCPELNVAVGGKPKSQHIQGLAADVVPLNYSLRKAAPGVLACHAAEWDQFIYEFGRWLHISAAPGGRPPRREALMIGSWTGGVERPLDLAALPD